AKYELVYKRHHYRLITLGRDGGKSVANDRIGETSGCRTGEHRVDDKETFGARLREQLFDFGYGSNAARPIFLVAGLLDEIHHQKRGSLGVDGDGLKLGGRRRLYARPFIDDGLGRRWRAVTQSSRKRGKRQEMTNADHGFLPVTVSRPRPFQSSCR